MNASKLAVMCIEACALGLNRVTIAVTGVRPKGFPRGELLSVGTNGQKNYSVDPVKVIGWMRDEIQRESAKASA